MSPISNSRPRRWIAAVLLLAGMLGIAGTAQGGICPSAALTGALSAAPPHGQASGGNAEPRDGSTTTIDDSETIPAPHDAGAIPAAGICGTMALGQTPGAALAVPTLHSTTEPQPATDPTPGPDPTPHDRPPRQS